MPSQTPSAVNSAPYRQTLSQITTDTVEPNAAQIDKSSVFPRAAADSLAAAGLLGLTVPTEFGGAGQGFAAATSDLLGEVGAGRHLSTLALSAAGSRSHVWAPASAATASPDIVLLDPRKSWVSAREPDSCVCVPADRCRPIGFPDDDEAAEISTLHTRNFM